MRCDVCGKETMMPDETQILGAKISFNIPKDTTPEYEAFSKEQLGPYKSNHVYRVCWECILRAFGIKP